MNTIEIKNIRTSGGYDNKYLFIDGKPLYYYLNQCRAERIAKSILPADELALTFTADFDHDGDERFMEKLIQMEKVNLPVLCCPDDLDFSCVVITAETEKTENFVYWKIIGIINHSVENFEEEKEHGIIFTDNYSVEDWNKYGDIAFMKVNSPEWCKWISENWSEELFRRRMNYTYPCYQNEKNIDMILECNWCFERKIYDNMIFEEWRKTHEK